MAFYPKESNILVIGLGSWNTLCGSATSLPVMYESVDEPLLLKQVLKQSDCSIATNSHSTMLVIPVDYSVPRVQDLTRHLFQDCNVPALCVIDEPVACIFATGGTSGLIIDVGHVSTKISVVVEHCVLPYCTVVVPLGGADITALLAKHLGSGFTESDACEIKEKHSIVSMSPKIAAQQTLKIEHKGQTVNLDSHAKCCEVLFDPSLIGKDCLSIQDAVSLAISKCELEKRTTLWENLILTGGCSLIPGILLLT